MTAQLNGHELDPNRPFARLERGESVEVIEAEDVPQWIADWLDWCGLTAEELLDRHDRYDFEGYEDRHAWFCIGIHLERSRYACAPDPAE